ncbi:GAF domain-containing protein [Henriciella barbarensis]|uniref:histidine kinase n=1 Tax=Henriciella barbarensis TaxID=86342 RepID=A0A399R017_9PROT|nr:GAF domain-containing protein [Henriciella barbarensis]RIJ24500.1 GAF domain-containing protein [Henriciella barbarensis]
MSETERLNALVETNLLDSEQDERFDRLTRLAANSLEVETALVSLIDSDRQWFKSCHGFSSKETSRDISFCTHAIERSDITVVLDATKDPRFASNPLVTGDPHIRFYAGAPLIMADGHAIGTLCVIDYEPRETFDDTDREILRDIADSVIGLIQRDEKLREMSELSVINRELQHRMGNMYAHVSSLISLLDKADLEHEEYVSRLREKVNALALTQSLIASSGTESVSMRELAQKTLAAFEAGAGEPVVQVEAESDFDITPRAAFAMSLMLHELGINSVKHGALGGEGGQACFGWSSGDHLRFSWEESLKTPRVDNSLKKAKGGFGSVILKRIAPKTFGGEAEIDIQPGSYRYTVSALPERILASEQA